MRFRGKSIRRKIVALLLVPLVSLTALWGFATVLTGREANQLLDVTSVVEEVGNPVADTVGVIQKERRQTLIYLADRRASDALPNLRREREATDKAIAKIKTNMGKPGVRDDMRSDSSHELNSLLEALDGLGALRRSVETGTVSRTQALEYYNRLVDPCYSFLLTLHALDNAEMERQARALVGLVRALEMLSREDALIASSLVTRNVTAAEIRALSDFVAKRELYYETNLEVLPAGEREIYRQYWRSPKTAPCATPRNASSPQARSRRRAHRRPRAGRRPPPPSSTTSAARPRTRACATRTASSPPRTASSSRPGSPACWVSSLSSSR